MEEQAADVSDANLLALKLDMPDIRRIHGAKCHTIAQHPDQPQCLRTSRIQTPPHLAVDMAPSTQWGAL